MRREFFTLLLVRSIFIAAVILTSVMGSRGQIITAFADGIGDSLSATIYGRVQNPKFVLADRIGNAYFYDANNRIRRISPAGNVTTVVGNGNNGTGIYEQIPIYNELSGNIGGIMIDSVGNFYVSNFWAGNNTVQKITPSGFTTIAGNGTCCGGFSGDGSLATNAQLNHPEGITMDRIGNIYIADEGNNRIRKVDTAGIITTIAGGGSTLGDGGPAVSAELHGPTDVAVDAFGNVYIADFGNSAIRKVNTAGIISTVLTGYDVAAVQMDQSGNIFFPYGYKVDKLSTSGVLSVVAGNGTTTHSGDGGPAISAGMQPVRVAIDKNGNLFIADDNGYVRKVNTAGVISTIAGNGLGTGGYTGDGGPALLAECAAGGLSADRAGNVYLTQANNIRKVNAAGTITTIAGSGIIGYFGDGGPAIAAELDAPAGTANDYAGNLYIADEGTEHIRKITPAGTIYTVAGGGTTIGDGGPATAASISAYAVAADSAGNLYIADGDNNRVRKVTASTGIITTIAGTGVAGTTGDNGPATAAEIYSASSIAVDRAGNVFVSSRVIRKIDTAGIITTFSPLNGVLATDSVGNLYIGDNDNYTIYKVDKFGYQSVVAGTGYQGYMGDKYPATAAEFNGFLGLAIDPTRHLYVSDNSSGNIRVICCMSTEVDNPPLFTHSNSATLSICAGAGAVNIDSLLSITDLDAGQTETWTIAAAPAHGTLAGFAATTISTGGTVLPSGLTYTPTTGFSGTDYFTIAVSDGSDQNTLGVTVTVNPLPNARSISGSTTVCKGATINLTDGSSGGTWASSSAYASVSTAGVVTGVNVGTSIISYKVTNACGTAVATHAIAVHVTPASIGGTSLCQGPIGLTDFLTISVYPDVGGTGGVTGTWSTTSPHLSIDTSSLIGLSSGVGNITYTLTNGCYAIGSVTVNPAPNAGSISGFSTLCAGSTMTVADGAGGGTWSSGSNATISSIGFVTAVSAGTTDISYTVTNSCGSATATFPLTILPRPNAGTITGPNSVCASSLIVLSDTATGGTWSSVNPRVSIGETTGVVVGIAPGPAIVYYTFTNACGTAIDSTAINVVTNPWAGTISGYTTVCAGDSTTLSDTVRGGAWSSGDPLVATVSGTGELHGISTGSAFVSYTVSNACGNAVALAIVNVTASTPIDDITGASTLCSGLTTTLSDGTPGGTWSSSDTAVAKVNASGHVSGVTGGVVAISYTVNAGCGLSLVTALMNIESSPSAGTVSGPATLCAGATNDFTSTVSGGTWTASNGHASMTPVGIITGISSGTDTISYSVSNSCGTAIATQTLNIFPAPVAGAITGDSTGCAGTSLVLTDGATGGVWSSNNATVAEVGGTGTVNGVGAGTAIISYSVTTGCGTIAATKTVTINATNAGFISGITTLCTGGISTLSDAVGGGVWSSSSPTVASIGSSTGVVNANAPGPAVIFYTVTGPCGVATASTIFTVSDLPTVSPVLGVPALCVGASSTFTDGTLGGTWSSGNSLVATAGSTGTITGVGAGTATISYLVTAGCGTAGATAIVEVEAMPIAGTITGPGSLCQGNSATLTDGISGGTWHSSNSAVATVGTTGGAQGVAAGTAVITYTYTNVCGSATATQTLTINPLPDPGVLSGGNNVCAGSSLTLTPSVTGGAWSSGNPAVGSVNASGNVSGISEGAVDIYYSIGNGCGTATVTKTITVNPLPYAGTITGDSVFCADTTIELSDTAASGIWSSGNTAIAAVSGTGGVRGNARGATTIFYTVTNSCGTAQSTFNITVNAPFAGSITGINTLCVGGSTLLSDTTGGSSGTWASTTPTVATVGSTGIASAVAPGTTQIIYIAPGICGADTTSILFTVGSGPSLPPITGAAAVCAGDSVSYTDGTTGGTWASGNSAVASVSPSGYVTGVASGTATISYTVYAGCGNSIATQAIAVDTVIHVGVIVGKTTLCKGTSDTLTETTEGGIWASSNVSVAGISDIGILTSADTGIVSISYAVSNSCGSRSANHIDTVISIPYAGTITGNTDICVGNTTMLSDAINGGAWSSNVPGIASIGSAGFVSGIAPGVSAISYSVTNRCGTGIATTPVSVSPLPGAGTITGPDVVCTSAQFKLFESNAGYWNSGNALVASIDSLTGDVHAVTTGTAIITFTTEPNAGNCVNTATFVLAIVASDPFVPSATVSPVDCYGSNSGSISVLPGSDPYRIGWSNGDSSLAISNLYQGVYTAYITDLVTACTSIDSFTVISPDSIAVVATVNDDSCNAGDGSISVSVSGGVPGYHYLWSTNATGASIDGLRGGIYNLEIADKNNCQKRLTFDIAEVNCGSNDVVVHDVITPNGDGINDVWTIEGLQKYPGNSVQVFDKVGNQVYQKSNYDNSWGGQASNGDQLPDGTYYYLVKLNAPSATGGSNVFSGAILIKR